MRKVLIGFLVVGALVGVVGAAVAQDAAAPLTQGLGREMMTLASEQTGLEPADLLRQIRQGSTLGDLIIANGGDTQRFVDQTTALLTERIEAAVADGRMARQRADRILGNLDTWVTQAVSGEGPLNRLRQRRAMIDRGVVTREVLQIAAEQTGLDLQAIVGELRSGSTLADVLTAHGVEPEAFIDSVTGAAQTRFDTWLEQFREQLAEHIHQSNPTGGI
ncbi:MAG: hypothetical protein K8J31_09130 [Anaerolineae bacterium]|nr:hypothetical protein [Anaerolineae bacterium]